ncbi:TATA-binding protein-associated factor mot1 [Pestalotiopsis sp. IQ-011]
MPRLTGSRSPEGDENNTMVGGDEGDEKHTMVGGDDANAEAAAGTGSGSAISAGASTGPATAGTNPGGQATPGPSRIDQAYDAITLALQGTDMDPEVRVKDQDNSGKTAKQIARAKATEGDRYRGWLSRAERIEGEAAKTDFWRKNVRAHRARENALALQRAQRAQQQQQQGMEGREEESAVTPPAAAAAPAQAQPPGGQDDEAADAAAAAAPDGQREISSVRAARDGDDGNNRLVHLGTGVVLWHGKIHDSLDA